MQAAQRVEYTCFLYGAARRLFPRQVRTAGMPDISVRQSGENTEPVGCRGDCINATNGSRRVAISFAFTAPASPACPPLEPENVVRACPQLLVPYAALGIAMQRKCNRR